MSQPWTAQRGHDPSRFGVDGDGIAVVLPYGEGWDPERVLVRVATLDEARRLRDSLDEALGDGWHVLPGELPDPGVMVLVELYDDDEDTPLRDGVYVAHRSHEEPTRWHVPEVLGGTGIPGSWVVAWRPLPRRTP